METTSLISWSHPMKWLFRFVFLYLILFTFPFPLTVLFQIIDFNFFLWRLPVLLTGEYILKLDEPIAVMFNGSGDTTFHYVQVFLFTLLSLIGLLLWSALDRKRLNYNKLHYWLVVLVRYYLAIISMGYGFGKVIKTQFPFPFLGKLLEPVGDLSPMGLLWTFMGYSTPYNIFCGLIEVAGGLLLFFRRTTMLGALILLGAYLNIVVLNFSYDVPVKLFSSHLLLMCLFLLTPFAKRLWQFMVLQQSVEAVPLQPVFDERKKQIGLFIAKILLIGFLIFTQVESGLSRYDMLNQNVSTSRFDAIYNVNTFVLRGDTMQAMPNNTARWKSVVIDRGETAKIEYMDGVEMYLKFMPDTVNHTIRIANSPKGYGYDFQYSPIDNTHYLWKGLMGQDSLKLVVQKQRKHEFELVNRGFHWINEYPYNR